MTLFWIIVGIIAWLFFAAFTLRVMSLLKNGVTKPEPEKPESEKSKTERQVIYLTTFHKVERVRRTSCVFFHRVARAVGVAWLLDRLAAVLRRIKGNK